MRAAVAALQFEHPKLSAAAVVHDDGTFAARLERALERSGRALTNGDGAKLIEHEPQAKVQSLKGI
jgi:ActR/RegA family two-component response regulator